MIKYEYVLRTMESSGYANDHVFDLVGADHAGVGADLDVGHFFSVIRAVLHDWFLICPLLGRFLRFTLRVNG